jgi:hypothetical protein
MRRFFIVSADILQQIGNTGRRFAAKLTSRKWAAKQRPSMMNLLENTLFAQNLT